MANGCVIVEFDEIPLCCNCCSGLTVYGTCLFTNEPILDGCSKIPNCPIKLIPEKKSEWDMYIIEHESFALGEHAGWNKCIEKLFGPKVKESDDLDEDEDE